MHKRILIADDHLAIRSGIRDILSAEYASLHFGEAVDSDDVFHKLDAESWDMVILDIDLPGKGGLDVLRRMTAENISIPVVVMSFHREQRIMELAMQCGALRYVTKDDADTRLVPAVNEIFAG
ncbi:MAG TPA: response regulator transcription factor [Sphingobacteriaceae bacterium]